MLDHGGAIIAQPGFVDGTGGGFTINRNNAPSFTASAPQVPIETPIVTAPTAPIPPFLTPTPITTPAVSTGTPVEVQIIAPIPTPTPAPVPTATDNQVTVIKFSYTTGQPITPRIISSSGRYSPFSSYLFQQ